MAAFSGTTVRCATATASPPTSPSTPLATPTYVARSLRAWPRAASPSSDATSPSLSRLSASCQSRAQQSSEPSITFPTLAAQRAPRCRRSIAASTQPWYASSTNRSASSSTLCVPTPTVSFGKAISRTLSATSSPRSRTPTCSASSTMACATERTRSPLAAAARRFSSTWQPSSSTGSWHPAYHPAGPSTTISTTPSALCQPRRPRWHFGQSGSSLLPPQLWACAFRPRKHSPTGLGLRFWASRSTRLRKRWESRQSAEPLSSPGAAHCSAARRPICSTCSALPACYNSSLKSFLAARPFCAGCTTALVALGSQEDAAYLVKPSPSLHGGLPS